MPDKKPEIDLSEFRRVRKAGCSFANLAIKDEDVDTLKAADAGRRHQRSQHP